MCSYHGCGAARRPTKTRTQLPSHLAMQHSILTIMAFVACSLTSPLVVHPFAWGYVPEKIITARRNTSTLGNLQEKTPLCTYQKRTKRVEDQHCNC